MLRSRLPDNPTGRARRWAQREAGDASPKQAEGLAGHWRSTVFPPRRRGWRKPLALMALSIGRGECGILEPSKAPLQGVMPPDHMIRGCPGHRRVPLVRGRLRRWLPAENAAAGKGMREPPLFGDHIRQRRPGLAPFDEPRLIVETPERGEPVVASELRLLHRRLHDGDRLVIDFEQIGR